MVEFSGFQLDDSIWFRFFNGCQLSYRFQSHIKLDNTFLSAYILGKRVKWMLFHIANKKIV